MNYGIVPKRQVSQANMQDDASQNNVHFCLMIPKKKQVN